MEPITNAFREIAQIVSQPCHPDSTTNDEPVDEFEFNCNKCMDRGWVTCDTDTKDPLFGQSLPCPECGPRRRIEMLWEWSGIADEDKENTIASFKTHTPAQLAALSAIKEIIAGVSQVDLVLIYGPPGTGKSHLGTAAVLDWILNGKPARIIRCSEWLERLRATFGKKQQRDDDYQSTTEDIQNELYLIDYLVIDEVKCRTDFEWDVLDEVVGRRYDRHYPTIVLTNKDLPELREHLSRIVSRSGDRLRGRRVLLDGDDWRER